MALDRIWFVVTIPFYGYPFGVGGNFDSSLIVHFIVYALLMYSIYHIFRYIEHKTFGFWDLARMTKDFAFISICLLAFGTEFTQGFAFGNNALNFFDVYDLAASWSGSVLVWRLLLVSKKRFEKIEF